MKNIQGFTVTTSNEVTFGSLNIPFSSLLSTNSEASVLIQHPAFAPTAISHNGFAQMHRLTIILAGHAAWGQTLWRWLMLR